MSRVKIRIAIKDRNKVEEGLHRFQKISSILRKKCKQNLYFTKKRK